MDAISTQGDSENLELKTPGCPSAPDVPSAVVPSGEKSPQMGQQYAEDADRALSGSQMALSVQDEPETSQSSDPSSAGFSNPAITDSPTPRKASHSKGDPHAGEKGHDSWADPLYRNRWISIILVYVVMFITVFQGSVYWSSLWPFLSSIDPTADEAFMGYIIMSFNMARVVSAPLLGWLSNLLNQTKLPILSGMAFVIAGNVGILFIEAVPRHRKWCLLAARATIGFGTGNAGPLFAYIIMASTVKERSMVITARTAIASLGMILGPALQTVFVPIGFPGRSVGPLHVNMYTTPALTCASVGFGMMIIFARFFEETWISVAESERGPARTSSVSSSTSERAPPAELVSKLPPYDKLAVGVTILTKFVIMFCYTYDITLASPLTMIMFQWTAEKAVLYLGIIQMCGAVVCLIASCVTGRYILRRFQERSVIIVGVISFLFFFAASFSWPGGPPLSNFAAAAVDNPNGVGFLDAELTTTTGVGPPSLMSSSPNRSYNSSAVPLDRMRSTCVYSWCVYTTRIYIFQYILGYFFMLMGYVLVQSADGVLFSKLFGPRKQGTLSGIYQSGGKLGMSISPLINSRLFVCYGPRVAWGFGSGLIVSNMLVLALTYHRMLPLSLESELYARV